MSWHGHLALRYALIAGRTVGHDRHHGPLRVLRPLYPEGDAVCHHVLVHPPGGVAGGDELHLQVEVGSGAHAVITTPGATRFYRTRGPAAGQWADLRVATGGRLEWLPLENIAYAGCDASNHTLLHLDAGAQAMGWDILALGLPAADAPFTRGRFLQHLELHGTWLERGLVEATDRQLLASPLGWAGRSVMATAWFASAEPLDDAFRQRLLDAGREALDAAAQAAASDDPPVWGVTAAQPTVVVARALAMRVEPAMRGLLALRAAWRHWAWALPANPPRIWRT